MSRRATMVTGKPTGRARRYTLAVLAAVALAGCAVTPIDPSFGAGAITRDGSDTYSLTVAAGTTTARAAQGNVGGNTRVVFWRLADPVSTDQQSCARWVNAQTHSQQQGAALRITSVDNRTRAITVTKNVFGAAYWVFNVHVMDSGAAAPFTLIGQFNLAGGFISGGQLVPYPWRLCARVDGNRVSFLAWPASRPQPAWGDPAYGGSVTLPPGWSGAGRPGWYVGHLRAGESVGFTNLVTTELSLLDGTGADGGIAIR